jgi:hypothetical protein
MFKIGAQDNQPQTIVHRTINSLNINSPPYLFFKASMSMVRLGGAQWSVGARSTGEGDLIWALNPYCQISLSGMVRTIFGVF